MARLRKSVEKTFFSTRKKEQEKHIQHWIGCAPTKISNYTDDEFLQPLLDKYSHSRVASRVNSNLSLYKCNHNFMADKYFNKKKPNCTQVVHEQWKKIQLKSSVRKCHWLLLVCDTVKDWKQQQTIKLLRNENRAMNTKMVDFFMNAKKFCRISYPQISRLPRGHHQCT